MISDLFWSIKIFPWQFLQKQESFSTSNFNLICFWRLVWSLWKIMLILIPNPALDFWNSDPKIHFWENLGPKIQSCLLCLKIGAQSISRMLIPNPDLDLLNIDPKIHFWANLGRNIQSCSFCLKIGAPSISRMLIPNPNLDFWNFCSKIHFRTNLGPKTQSCPFCLEIGTHGISKMLILIPTLVFWILNFNFLFGQILAKKVKLVGFNWTLARMISRGCWFLFQH